MGRRLPLRRSRQAAWAAIAAAAMLYSAPNAALEGAYVFTGLGLMSLSGSDSTHPVGSPDSGARSVGVRIGGGYQFDPNWAFEINLSSLGRVGASSGDGTAKWSASAFGLSSLALLPREDGSAWFARAGLHRVSLGLRASSSAYSAESRRWSPGLGFGWQKDASRLAGWRVEFERLLKVGDGSTTGSFGMNTLFVSLYHKF